jgi:hypothetical protein
VISEEPAASNSQGRGRRGTYAKAAPMTVTKQKMTITPRLL